MEVGLISLFTWTALAATPVVDWSWRGDEGRLTVLAPEGQTIASDAPLDLSLDFDGRTLVVAGVGADALRGVVAGGVQGDVAGLLGLTLCSKTDGACVPHEFTLAATVPTGRKGLLAFDVELASQEETSEEHSPFRADAAAAASAAFEAASRDGDLVLLDFSAVWCPPCNLLGAEVLHSEPSADALGAFALAILDVDDPSSWAVKDRYKVGSYPTMVLTDAAGTELDRMVGYPGRDAVLAWLGEVAERRAPMELDPESLAPERAGEQAWTLVQRGVHDVEALVARAEEGEDGFALRAARLVQAGQVEDARWILEHHADNVDALLGFTILGLLEEAPDLGEPLAAAVSGTLARTSDGETAGDLLYLLGSLEERPAFFAAGASALRGSFTGEPSLDRGHYTFLATLMSKGGDLDGALGFLASCSERWPDEPTFQLKSASLLLEERPGDSLAAADAAIAVAWGDNLLRASKARAQALVALGRAEEAAGYARSVLDDHPAPEEGLAVRTHRYRKALEELAESAP